MDKQTIAIDWSSGEDQTVVSNMCGNCGHVFDAHDYEPYANNVDITVYKKCPNCGVEFKQHMINE